ncbi:OsmC family protein [Natroniella sulfidigena]|uniref:OsmC family protein n=1 Tax=Natroniella sulfidigena TaxID=723921 RepID=UPI00200A5485|nr:OsmC family protein [Natroniella sulfidigena]MCK8817778.1 OsmC family protein [Natroniella sulfidigena]
MKRTVVRWEEANNYQVQMSCGDYTVTSNIKDDSAFKPPELILASLGTCSGLFLKPALAERDISWDEFEVTVSGVKASPPNLFESITLEYEIKADVTAKELEEALEESHQRCLVMNTLDPKIEIKTDFVIK